MENQQLTDVELVMRYPLSIIEWEMKHGIARYEKNGMTYICCVRPFEDVCESIRKEEAENEKRRRLKELGLLQ